MPATRLLNQLLSEAFAHLCQWQPSLDTVKEKPEVFVGLEEGERHQMNFNGVFFPRETGQTITHLMVGLRSALPVSICLSI